MNFWKLYLWFIFKYSNSGIIKFKYLNKKIPQEDVLERIYIYSCEAVKVLEMDCFCPNELHLDHLWLHAGAGPAQRLLHHKLQLFMDPIK